MKVDSRETQAGGGSESYNIALRLKNQKNVLSVTKNRKPPVVPTQAVCTSPEKLGQSKYLLKFI